MKVTFQQEIEGKEGRTILDLARDAGVKIKAPCEKGKCGKCKVRVLEGEVSPLTKAEKKELSKKEIESGIRLACMVEAVDDAIIEVVKKKKK